jgi:hypothetical protein
MGLFSHGKSTLLNALLADRTHPVELHGHKGPMLTGLFPTTAVLTSIRYSEKPYVFARRYDGTSEEWTLSRYLDEAKLEDDGLRQQAERLLEIQEFGMGYPARICGSGVAIFDSPGLNDGSLHDKITGDELRRADAAVMLFNTRALLAMNETLVAEQLTDTDTPLFYVVNVIDDEDLPTRPELERYVWNRLVHKALRGPEYTDGVRLADRNVYLVDARKALNGRVRGDAAMVAGSGIVEFEQVLLGFLANDIAAAHMRKHVTSAQTATGALRHRLEERAEREPGARPGRRPLPGVGAEDRRAAGAPGVVAPGCRHGRGGAAPGVGQQPAGVGHEHQGRSGRPHVHRRADRRVEADDGCLLQAPAAGGGGRGGLGLRHRPGGRVGEPEW